MAKYLSMAKFGRIMLIIFLAIILIVLFGVWVVYAFYNSAVQALVNIAIGGMMILRMIHDLREKRNIALYLVSVGISTALIMLKDAIGLGAASRILAKIELVEAVQVLLLVFLVAQLAMLVDRKYFVKKKLTK